MKFMNVMKKFGSKVVEVAVSAKDKALGLLAVGSAVLLGTTPAKADFAADLTTLQTQVTTDLGAISTSQVAIMGVVFGLIALAIAFRWITRTGKSS